MCVCACVGETYTISISLQNSFCESHPWRLLSLKALRSLNARWVLLVYPIFEDEKSNQSDQKLVKRKTGYCSTSFEGN